MVSNGPFTGMGISNVLPRGITTQKLYGKRSFVWNYVEKETRMKLEPCLGCYSMIYRHLTAIFRPDYCTHFSIIWPDLMSLQFYVVCGETANPPGEFAVPPVIRTLCFLNHLDAVTFIKAQISGLLSFKGVYGRYVLFRL